MIQCPECKKWTLEFDDYFGRFRCFNPDCGWMVASSAERRIHLLNSHEEPEPICIERLPESDITIAVTYDRTNDVLSFDFCMQETTFDLPEPDGRVVWKVGNRTGDVVGFEILNAKNMGVSEIQVDIAKRKENIENCLKRMPLTHLSVKPSRMLITGVSFRSKPSEPHPACDIFKEAVEKFQSAFM